jgi:putative endonuclease
MAKQRDFVRIMFYVYVIVSGKEKYIGFTKDLVRRLSEHNSGKSTYTKRHKDWRVLYYEAHTNEDDARRRERYLKTSSGQQSLRNMLKGALYEKTIT